MNKKMPVSRVQGSYTSTNAYKSALKANLYDIHKGTIIIKNKHASYSILWKVLVSDDELGKAGSWIVDKAEAELAAEALASYNLPTSPFHHIDVQIKSSSTDSHSGVDNWLYAVR